ncbi:MAG: tryptophan synthase subunit alpha [Aquificae bacterium]|nr:tryptophan synthase subunit alpha [Aquificota bacterium]
MGRLSETFRKLKEEGKKALVSYLMVGYPDYETSLLALKKALSGGSDILEVGVPFSDPVADGPTIQLAHEVALRNRTKLRDVLRAVSELRQDFPDTPILLMTYYNPIFRKGLGEFCELIRESGADGLIVPDLPPEEAEPLKKELSRRGLSFVPLGAPTSTRERLSLICESADEMVYFVSVTGTTGARESLPYERIKRKVEEYRTLCDKPVVVGFGVSKPEHARRIGEFSDGVVVGSALVNLCAKKDVEGIEKLVRELKGALV